MTAIKSRLIPRRRRDTAEPIVGATIGDIDGPTAIIGPRGTIGALDGSWRFEWGAGAADRWHLAHDDSDVRQKRIDDTPVFETAMRVPGGDVICRVGSGTDGESRSLTLEFINASPGGVALGCVLHLLGPSPVSGHWSRSARRGGPWVSVDRSEMRVDDRVVLSPARRAGGVVAGTGAPWPMVTAGPRARREIVGLDGSSGHAAMVFALPHRASLSMRIALDTDLDGKFPVRVASPADMAAGWRAVTRRAADIGVPDARLNEAWLRVVPDLVIAAGSDDPIVAAGVAPYLDIAGLHREADRARATVVVAAEARRLVGPAANAAMVALASRDLRAGEPSGLNQLIGGLLADAGGSLDSDTLVTSAMALRGADQRLADDLLRLADERRGHRRSESGSHRSGSGSASTSSSVVRGAEAVIGRLVGPVADGVVDLLPMVPDAWFGQPLDVRGLVTHVGTMSFSIRWHGARPALLWDREGGPDAVRITCCGLDPTWASSDRRAEALLVAPVSRG